MTFRRIDLCVAAGFVGFLLLASAGRAQNPPPAKEAPPPPQINPATQAAIAAQAAQAQAKAPESKEPDYPDPRSLSVGLSFMGTFGGKQPSIYGGGAATGYETLTDLGRNKDGPGVEVSMPVTRTGSLIFEGFRVEGDANQYAPAATTVFGQSISQGDYLETRYRILAFKIGLDDLLFPHRFPVSRFRLKSLWQFQYARISDSAYAPFVPVSSTTGTFEYAAGGNNIFLPTFGLAAEYAPNRHVLFRIDGSGFGLYHRSDLYEGNATVSYRFGSVDVKVGAKIFHAKSSPKGDEYQSVTINGVFVGVTWHTPLFERTR